MLRNGQHGYLSNPFDGAGVIEVMGELYQVCVVLCDSKGGCCLSQI